MFTIDFNGPFDIPVGAVSDGQHRGQSLHLKIMVHHDEAFRVFVLLSQKQSIGSA